jgi:hypothetical protein
MPQAPVTLSPQRRHALETSYTFFRGLASFLDSISLDRPDHRLIAVNLRDLGALAQRQLVEAFPELHEWLNEWTRGGVS